MSEFLRRPFINCILLSICETSIQAPKNREVYIYPNYLEFVLLKDIDGKLDMRCTIKIDQYDSIFNLSRALNLRIPVFVSEENGSFFAKAYFPEKLGIQGLSDALIYFGAKLFNGRFELINPIANKKLIDVLGPLSDVPSTSSLRVSAEKGKIVTRFRFHSNYSPEISKIASSAIRTLSASVKIGTPSSINSLLKWYDEKIESISVVGYLFPINSVNDDVLLDYLKKGILELSYSPVSLNKKFLLYLFDNSEKKLDLLTVSQDEHIYEAPIKSEFINHIWKGFTEKSISRIYTFLKLSNRGIRGVTFVPTWEADLYVTTLMESGMRIDVTPEIDILNNYNADMWNYL